MIEVEPYLALRARFRTTGEIDQDLYGLLHHLSRAVIFGSRLAPAYSPTGHWDTEAHLEALHDWIERRLLRTNALLAAFDLAEHPRPFLNSLERNFRHHLENARERGELGNLISRTGALLREDGAFTDRIPAERPAEVWWGLAAWQDHEPWGGRDADLLAAAWSLGEVAIFRYSASVERASPVLSTDTLRTFLEELFDAVDQLLTLSHLAVVFRDRFDLGTPETLDIDDVPGPAAESEEPLPEWVEEAAAAFLAELEPRQLEALRLRHEGKTLEAIADALGVSRGTADNLLRGTGPMLDKHCVDGVTRDGILEKVIDVLSSEGEISGN
jgi:Sigma-70, region 4